MPNHGAPPSVAHLLQALQAQLLVHDFSRKQEQALLDDYRSSRITTEWRQDPRNAKKQARVMTVLCAMTHQDRWSTHSWLPCFIAHSALVGPPSPPPSLVLEHANACLMSVFCVQLRGEVEAFLMATAKDAHTGEPRHPEAVLVSGLPQELVRMVIHQLALAHVVDERAKIIAQWWSPTPPGQETSSGWVLTNDWHAKVFRPPLALTIQAPPQIQHDLISFQHQVLS